MSDDEDYLSHSHWRPWGSNTDKYKTREERLEQYRSWKYKIKMDGINSLKYMKYNTNNYNDINIIIKQIIISVIVLFLIWWSPMIRNISWYIIFLLRCILFVPIMLIYYVIYGLLNLFISIN